MQDQTFSYKTVKSLATPKVSNLFSDSNAKKEIVATDIHHTYDGAQATYNPTKGQVSMRKMIRHTLMSACCSVCKILSQLEGIWKRLRQLWGRAYFCLGGCYPLWSLCLGYLFLYSLFIPFTIFLFVSSNIEIIISRLQVRSAAMVLRDGNATSAASVQHLQRNLSHRNVLEYLPNRPWRKWSRVIAHNTNAQEISCIYMGFAYDNRSTGDTEGIVLWGLQSAAFKFKSPTRSETADKHMYSFDLKLLFPLSSDV